MMWRQIIALAAVGALVGCTSDGGALTYSGMTAAQREAELPNIFEPLFRHQFEHNNSAVQQKAKAYYLEIAKGDPSAEFLQRFAGDQPPVKPGSQFQEPGSQFQDDTGLLFSINSWEWIDDRTVKVMGGYYEHGESASKNEYRMEQIGGKWIVKEDKLLVIS